MLNKIWTYLSGKKRNIALVYWSLVLPALAIMYPEGAPDILRKSVELTGLMLGFIGLGHAAVKSSSVKDQ